MDFDLTQEQQMIRQAVREFAEKEIAPNARHVDETGEFPAATFRKMGELGLMGIPFAEEFGGAPIALFGSQEQRRAFLKPAAAGKYIAAFGLTEPHAGSDAGATRTTARLEGHQWVLNGSKMWITNAPVAGHKIGRASCRE